MAEKAPIITLITDFGENDHYVASMKGVMLWINPVINIVDITHNVIPHDIFEAAFILKNAYRYFPPHSIHMIIVDPEVGSSRRPILVCTDNHQFICPDNGLLTMVLEEETVIKAYEITAQHYRRGIVSDTFHGRDIFAPAAAWLSKGLGAQNLGDEISDIKRIEIPAPVLLDGSRINGQVIHIDRFGNAILNVNIDFLQRIDTEILKRKIRIKSGNVILTEFKKNYSEGETGKPFFLLNSSNFLEIAMNRSSAASILLLKRGSEIQIEIE
jgi:S-adenosylmethionine hydrolase